MLKNTHSNRGFINMSFLPLAEVPFIVVGNCEESVKNKTLNLVVCQYTVRDTVPVASHVSGHCSAFSG